jgi:hypothetical protein
MLEFLSGKASERKLRLFALACCRRIDRLIADARGREALEFAERHVDVGVVRRKGRAVIEREVRKAHMEAYNKMFSFPAGEERAKCLIVSNALDAAAQLLNTSAATAAHYVAAFSSFAVAWEAQVASGVAPYPYLQDSFKRPEQTRQARTLRDLFGNPYRPFALNPSWLRWKDGALAKMARAIYDQRRFGDLPVLADALEDAGCADTATLGHCRGGGEHVRGCWVVDLLLGKE